MSYVPYNEYRLAHGGASRYASVGAWEPIVHEPSPVVNVINQDVATDIELHANRVDDNDLRAALARALADGKRRFG